MSHEIDPIVGDVLGGGLGFVLSGFNPLGAALGGALGGAAGSAIGGGNITQDALSALGGAASGFGIGEGIDALTGLASGAVDAGTGAATAAGSAATDTGGATAGSAFGGITSDAAGGATLAEGIPLASTYGPVSAFATDAGTALAADASGAAAALPDTGATTLAAGDTVSPLGGTTSIPATTPTVAATPLSSSAPSVGPGLSSSASSPLASNAVALGASPTAGPGAGTAVFTPSPAAAGSPGVLDPTSTLATGGGSGFSPALGQNPGSDLVTLSSSTENGVAPVVDAQGYPLPPATGGASAADIAQGANNAAAIDALSPSEFQSQVAAGTLPGETPTIGQSVSNFFSPVTGAVDQAGSIISSPTGKLLSTGIAGAGLLHSLMASNNPTPIPGESQLAQLATQLGQESTALQNTGSVITNTGTNILGPNVTQATNVANQAQGQAATLENYLTSGTLPTPVQASLDQATNNAVTAIKAQYAARGMPPGSSAEQQEIAAVQQNAVINGGSLAASLYSQGVGLDTLASQIYTSLTGTGANLVGAGTSASGAGTNAAAAGAGAQESVVGTNTGINTGVNNAIANLASALGGGSKAIVNGNTVTLSNAA